MPKILQNVLCGIVIFLLWCGVVYIYGRPDKEFCSRYYLVFEIQYEIGAAFLRWFRKKLKQRMKKDHTMKHVIIYTDGACSGNPGPGGWGAILRYGAQEKELSGGEHETTNNRMELLGVISALQALKEPCEVDLYSDSQYICQAINDHWLEGWKRAGWKRKTGELKNIDLWQTLDELLHVHKVTFHWVKGHADNPYNNRCDALAVAQRDKHK